MKPIIEKTGYGNITVHGKKFKHDIIITLEGKIRKRNKKLSKQITKTSHFVSLDEARDIFEPGAKKIIVGTGQYGVLKLTDDARQFFEKEQCELISMDTPDAISAWNHAEGKAIAMFHVCC